MLSHGKLNVLFEMLTILMVRLTCMHHRHTQQVRTSTKMLKLTWTLWTTLSRRSHIVKPTTVRDRKTERTLIENRQYMCATGHHRFHKQLSELVSCKCQVSWSALA